MNKRYNVYEAYLFKFKTFILGMSYTPGANIDDIIDDMKQTFNFHVIKLEGPTFLKSDSVFNYDKLNKDIDVIIEQNKKVSMTTMTYGTAILIHGLNFPNKLIKPKIDLQLHFSASTNLFLKTNPTSNLEEYNNFKYILSENRIGKYFNIKSNKSPDINNAVFDKLIDFFEFKVYGKDYNKFSTKSKLKPSDDKKIENKPKQNIETESESESESESETESESESEIETEEINTPIIDTELHSDTEESE